MDYPNLAPFTLVQLCLAKDPRAWEEFIYRYQRSIALTILRVLRHWDELSTTFLDDLVQETYVALCTNDCRLLRHFVETRPYSLDAMLRMVAANVTHDHIRARRSQKRGRDYSNVDSDSRLLQDAFSEDAERIERELQLGEIERLLGRAPRPISSKRDRSIFWMHFRSGMSAQSISEVPSVGLTPKGVESSIYRTLSFIRRSLRRQLG